MWRGCIICGAQRYLVVVISTEYCLLLLSFSTGATTHCGFVFCSPLAGL